MIYIKVELWPFGDKTKAKSLGEMYVANVGGTSTRGVYKSLLKDSKGRAFRKGEVTDFPRKRLGAFDLMYRALKNMVGDRNEKTGKGKNERRVR
jgi:hypothetical protein